LEQGFSSVLSGLESGISGLVNKPLEGAQKSGLEGFLEGSFKGVSGLFIKPITGKLFNKRTTGWECKDRRRDQNLCIV
jgi:vacuolar protein sorting-associated protein 13A/C